MPLSTPPDDSGEVVYHLMMTLGTNYTDDHISGQFYWDANKPRTESELDTKMQEVADALATVSDLSVSIQRTSGRVSQTLTPTP